MLLIYLDMIIISVVVIVGGAHCRIGSYNIVCSVILYIGYMMHNIKIQLTHQNYILQFDWFTAIVV